MTASASRRATTEFVRHVLTEIFHQSESEETISRIARRLDALLPKEASA